jgi:diguanylate cyclase (GGDEF)-like protein/PAS domain S-box-containing protein
MITSNELISVIFLISSLFYLYIGGQMLYETIEGRLSITYFLTAASLFIWGSSFSIASSSHFIESVYFWRRIAAIGWGSFFALMLHTIFELTREKKIRFAVRKKLTWWQYLLLYFPAILTIYAFSLSSNLATKNYNLVKGLYGWSNISSNNLWDIFFYLYYISYSIIGIVLLIRWNKKTALIREKKQAVFIMLSCLIAVLLGTISDVIFDFYEYRNFPEIAIALLVIPFSSIWYSIKKFRLLPLTPSTIAEDLLVNINDALIVTDHLGIIKMVNPSINGLLGYIDKDLLGQHINLLFCDDSLFKDLNKERILEKFNVKSCEKVVFNKDNIKKAVLVSAAPILDSWGDILGVVCVLTDLTEIKIREMELKEFQEKLVFKVEERTKELSDVNKQLLNEIDEKTKLMELQKLISEFSTDFISVNQWNFDVKIENMLSKFGTILNVDRAFRFIIDNKENTLVFTNKWYRNGLKSKTTSEIKIIDLGNYSWIINLALNKEILYIPNSDLLTAEAKEKDFLQKFHVKSSIAIPVEYNGKVCSFISFDTINDYKEFTSAQINMLKLLVNILSDGVSKIESDKEIQFLAYNDFLTKLPNRLQLIKKIEYHTILKKEIGFCLIFIDLDSFKVVNDTLGHSGGDLLLQLLASDFKNVVAEKGFISRISGDEFVIMLDNIDSEENAKAFMEDIMKIFDKTFPVENEEFHITASAGISFYPKDGDNADELIKNADLAMYQAKAFGKNQYRICSNSLKSEQFDKLNLINNMKRGIDKNEFVLYYQPQVCLKTNNIIGAEALIRWNNPFEGMISPVLFIPLAEQHGYINEIGEWVMRSACEQIKLWKDKGLKPIKVGVNLSVIQFKDVSLVEKVENMINEYNIEPQYLEIEITESVAMNEEDNILEILNKFKELGIKIAIDDFGTEHSSLSRIRELPIDKIKIDREFIKGLSENNKDKAITKTIILLGQNLNVKVIAEGAETKEQIEFLKSYGCDEVQGYYFYKPICAEDMEMLLDKENIDESSVN